MTATATFVLLFRALGSVAPLRRGYARYGTRELDDELPLAVRPPGRRGSVR